VRISGTRLTSPSRPQSTSCATNSWNCDARRMRAGMAPDR
jgi:hypothetical protein